MRLDKIELVGFKSFADRTIITFDKPVTSIVGPNGCGKSNIVDAFRWVMGEQSAKSMRGDTMVDVIFSGSGKRKVLNFAEVSITFTEINSLLPVDFDEICISRRLFRSGESEWYINKNPVRLKDIHSLFWDTGLGKDAFCIFEQGKMDTIINSNPIERRFVFESAAKVVRFKERKKEALRKLEHTDANLTRVQDIHNEVNQQIIRLQKQAEEARIFNEHKNELAKLKKGMLILKSKKYRNHLKVKVKEVNELNQTLKTDQDTFIQTEQAFQTKKNLNQQLVEKLRVESEELFEKRSRREVKITELQNHQMQIAQLAERASEIKTSLVSINEKLEADQKEKETQVVYFQENVRYQKEIKKALDTLTQDLKALEEKVHSEKNQHKQTQAKYLNALQEENQLQAAIKEKDLRLENSNQQLKDFQEKKTSLLDQKSQLDKESVDQKKHIDSLSQKIDKEKAIFKNLEAQIQQADERTKSLKKDLNFSASEIQGLKVKGTTLNKLQEDMEGCSISTKKLLKASSDPKCSFYQKLTPLAEIIIPLPGYESIIANAMHPYLQTLVIDNIEDMQQVIDYADQHNLKNFSLIAKSKINANANINQLSSFAEDNEVAKHFLNKIDYQDALPLIASESLKSVTIYGKDFFIDAKGVLFHVSLGSQNLFHREAELKKISYTIKKLKAKNTELNKSYEQATAASLSLLEKYKEKDKEMRQQELSLLEINFSYHRNKEAHARVEKQFQNCIEKHPDDTKALQQIEVALEDLTKQLTTLNKEKENYHKDFSAIDSSFEESFALLKEKRNKQSEVEERYRDLTNEIQKLTHKNQLIDHQHQEYLRQISFYHEEIHKNTEKKNLLMNQAADFEKVIKDYEVQLNIANDSYQQHQLELQTLNAQIESFEKHINEARTQQELLKHTEMELRIAISQLETNYNTTLNDLDQSYGLNIDEIDSFDISFIASIREAEKRIPFLQNELEKHPEINLAAIAECEEHRTRSDFLDKQLLDLNNAKTELVDIITTLDKTSKKTFKETFATIRTNFKKNYLTLFNGGEADLKLTENADILEAGIEIVAKPPGKQMRSIQLLSGGEKCLTAIALLFALFETRPIPFCILDEIDAPLDDANIDRFTNVLKQFMKKNQLIIITHNKRTMAIADILFGVSMQERGVSQIIPLKFKTEKEVNPQSKAVAIN